MPFFTRTFLVPLAQALVQARSYARRMGLDSRRSNSGSYVGPVYRQATTDLPRNTAIIARTGIMNRRNTTPATRSTFQAYTGSLTNPKKVKRNELLVIAILLDVAEVTGGLGLFHN